MSKVRRYLLQAVISIVIGVVVMLVLFFFLRFVLKWDIEDIGDFPDNMGRIASLVSFAMMSIFPVNRKTVKVAKANRDFALTSPSPAGHGTVYVQRHGFQGWGVGLDVMLDGQTMAFLRTPRFTRLDIAPGQHFLSITSSLKGAKKVPPSGIEFTLAPGEVVVFSFAATLKGPIPIIRETDTSSALKKLSTVTMVAPDEQSPKFSELAA